MDRRLGGPLSSFEANSGLETDSVHRFMYFVAFLNRVLTTIKKYQC